MQRRRFLTAIGSVIAWPLAAGAQQRTIPRVGVLVAESAPHPFTEAFRTGMRELGYVEGRTVAIDWRYADALFARAIALATELVRLKVDIIAAHHTPAVKAAMSVTSTIPIVMAPAGAPVQAGLIKSLAQPGGNVTGLSSMEAELGTKRLQLLVEMIPYSADHAAYFQRAAVFVDRILKGAKPANLPVEQPAKFELVVNSKTARALGLSIPQSVLVGADEIIR